MGTYDSPTFLGNKDKLVMGMTIGQVALFIGAGVFWLMLALSFEFSVLMSLALFGPAHGATVAFFLVKLSGMSIPMYLLAMVQSMVSATVYHVDAAEARRGMPEWFADIESAAATAGGAEDLAHIRQSGAGSRRWLGPLLFFRRRAAATAVTAATEESRMLAGLEAEQRANEAARGAQRTLRTMFRLMVKGHA